MIAVKMPRADWDTVVLILTDARVNGRWYYFDHIIDDINHALDTQEG